MIAVGAPAFAMTVSVSPPYATRGVAYSGQATAGGGMAPYTFTVAPGTLPPGLQMDGTGAIAGTPTHAGNYTFTVTATDVNSLSGSGSASISVAGTPLTMSPAAIPQGHLGVPYAAVTVSVSGGVPPYTVSVSSALPPGITFDSNTMTFSGTPTTANYYTVDLLMQDQAGDTSVYEYALPVPDIQPPTLSDGVLNNAYGAVFNVVGFVLGIGFTPTLSISAGNLPPGLSLSQGAGTYPLLGNPTAAGTFTFTIHAAGGGISADRVYSINILSSPPIGVGNLPSGQIGVPYSQTVPVFNATPPVTMTKTSGNIPPGLTLSPSGVLSGTPTGSGSYGFAVSVQDSTGKTGTGTVSLVIIPPSLSVAPATIPDGAVGQAYSVIFTGSGGIPPYRYHLALQNVPGLSLDSMTGILNGTPTVAGTYTVRVDVEGGGSSTGSQTYTFKITGITAPFTLPPSLPDGTQGKLYLQFVTAAALGDTFTSVNTVVSGGSLPPGIVLSTEFTPGFELKGVPTAPGSYPFQLTVTDNNNKSVVQNYSINVASQAIIVSPNSLPVGIATVPYSVTFTANGGTPPYTFAALTSGGGMTFPAGLTLSGDGKLQGAPAFGIWPFTVRATDSTGATGSWDYSLVIASSTVTIDPLQLPQGTIGKAYSTTLVAAGGASPYTFSLSNGTLPKGIMLSSAGALAGTPQQAGIFNNISVTAHDSVGAAGSRTYQLVINGAPITLGPYSLPDAFVNQPYSTQLTASGGTPPYTFSRPSANTWVAGLQVNSDGSISGTPTNTSAALLDFNVVATDANGSTGTREFQINLRSGTLSLTPTVLPSATAGSAYSTAITTSGGHAPYTFSLALGNPLPAGLSISGSGTLSGTPASSGNYPFIIQVQDSNGATGSQAYLLNVGEPANISLSPASLPNAASGTSYSTVITASGGSPPYSFSLAAGSNPPPGLSFSAGGILSGIPASAGSYPFTIQVQDNALATGTRAYVLNVVVPCSYGISPGGKVFPSTGGTGVISVTTGAGCSWTITNVPTWVALSSPASGTGSGTATFQLGLNNGPDLSSVLMVAGLPFTVQQQAASIVGMNFAGSMPHTATAENWTTTFTLVANGSGSAQTRLSLFGDDGSPLPVEFNLPQAPSSSGPLLAASLDRTIAPHALVVLDGLGPTSAPVQTGSAQLGATGAVGGFAIFHLIPNAQEAVVPMETRNASSYLLAFDNTDGVVLGVAMENVSTQAATIPVVIRDDSGAVIGPPGAAVALGGKGHTSFVLTSQYPMTANLRGTIEFDTPPDGQISVLGIRTTPLGPSNTLTTIPALAGVGTNGGSIAHLATGNGWQTTFVLVNTGASAANAHLAFFADDGSPLALPLGFPQSGTGMTSTASFVDHTLAAGASLIVQSTAPVSDLTPTIGSAQLTTNGNVGGFVIFRYNPNGQEAVVPLESRNANAYILAFDNTAGTATGVAINSVSMQGVNIPVTIRDDTGTQIATDAISLAANGHIAFTLATDKYPATANIRGTIEFDAPSGTQIGALGIRIPVAHTFTTLPALAK